MRFISLVLMFSPFFDGGDSRFVYIVYEFFAYVIYFLHNF